MAFLRKDDGRSGFQHRVDSPIGEQQRCLSLRDDPTDEMALYRLIRALQIHRRAGQDAAAEVPALLKRFKALRDEARQRQALEYKYRLVEDKPASERQ